MLLLMVVKIRKSAVGMVSDGVTFISVSVKIRQLDQKSEIGYTHTHTHTHTHSMVLLSLLLSSYRKESEIKPTENIFLCILIYDYT
jgi:hypothetical protein